ncbi:helix-turn-helix domain-containing protein [Enterococcus sp. BWM-S5]|uniref:Helix-turn-helix domain-containing protein n=1 Tax=Enterococcus larvae TaxID=2794352 RepID=A0ABS4CNI6_9ENTE|nr:XRE family transcriptional regulator [Enterococcus larvae]MBP1048020.1 helix-turn-helix domain-containing protein [Enterococcus larvae]
MDIKAELGKKVRLLREKKGLTREDFCDDELELTVRQLTRIEAGQSLPTLPKLTFISQRLAIPIHHLIDEEHIELPKRYLQLKYKLYKVATYNEEERLTLREKYFDEIYENYYDNLPEEEQLAIDVQQATMDVHLAENADFGEGILSDYFSQIINKTEYSINDLLIIELYFHCIHFKDYDEELFMSLFNKVIEQIDYSVDIELFLLNKLLLIAISVFMEYDNYNKLIDAVKVSNVIMQISQDFQKKPAIDMCEGKYWLFSQKDVEKAKQKYVDGAQCAKLFGDSFLSGKILEEWEIDLEKFKNDYQN